jgi:hypothetical protein
MLGKRGWKPKTILQHLKALDDLVKNSLSSHEDIETALEETGIALDFDDPFDRVQEA